MSVDDQLTLTPQRGRIKKYTEDTTTGLKWVIIHMQNAGDYYPFHGPSSEQFYEDRKGMGSISFNVCDKPYTAFYKDTPNSSYTIESGRPAFKNPRYASGEGKAYGPYFVVAEQDDTYYFCVQTQEAFDPIDYEVVHLKAGDSFDSSSYKGWCVGVMTGCLDGLPQWKFARLSSGSSFMALEKSTIVVVRPRP